MCCAGSSRSEAADGHFVPALKKLIESYYVARDTGLAVIRRTLDDAAFDALGTALHSSLDELAAAAKKKRIRDGEIVPR